MTVIACDGITIALDKSRNYKWISLPCKKYFYSKKDNAFLTLLGLTTHSNTILDWYLHDREIKNFPYTSKECEGSLLAFYHNRLELYADCGIPEIHKKYPIAFGSGQEMALGAMLAGATAVQAVKIANKHIPSCGFGCDRFLLSNLKKG